MQYAEGRHLSQRIALAKALMVDFPVIDGGFSCRQRIGAPPPPRVAKVILSFGHFPQCSNTKARCVDVYNRHGMRHESWTEYSVCCWWIHWLSVFYKLSKFEGLLIIIAFCHFLLPYSSSYCLSPFSRPQVNS